jgi:hypothetical protein
MKFKFILFLTISLLIIKPTFSNEKDCSEFKKYSTEYFECNTKKFKEKTNKKVKLTKDKLKKFKGSKTLSDLIKD